MDYNLFKGLVTHIIDPNNFWMQIGTDGDIHHFREYQQRLDAFYNTDVAKYTCDPDQMHAGYLVVAALEPVQGDRCHWERAQVTRVDSDNKTADVFLVDLGFAYIVELDRCRAITYDLFNFLPPQASRVSLGGVKPLSSSWTTRATNLLQKDTEGVEVLSLLMHYDETSMCYTVVLYTRQSDGTWRSLIHKMQEEELAVSTGDVIQEVLTDDIVDQCLQRMSEAEKNGENERTLVEEEEVEKWEDDCVAGGSDDFLANLIKSSQNEAAELQCQSSSPSDKLREVTGFDYRTLMQTRSISLSQMQLEKGMETQEVTKTNIERDLQRMESSQSHQDEQDWDTVQDTDCHVDIVSQIYQGVPHRQYSSDDGMSELWDGIKVHELATPPRKPRTAAASSSSYPLVMEDIGKRYYHPVDEREDSHGQNDYEMRSSNNVDNNDDDNDGGLSEIDSYRLEKQIKEILLNQEGMESDVVCASIYGVVEPDVDAPVDHLCVVICAILEHIMQDSSQHSEIAFAILETYSDAYEFKTAMIKVINDLKERFVKKHRNGRLSNSHKDFAHVLALVFEQAEDWEEGTCMAVRDLGVALTERWVIFNKQRHLSGDDLVQCELIFLESAQTFLLDCYHLLSAQYPSNLREIMKDIRYKLLQDETSRSVRTVLLDMLLNFNADGQLDKCSTCSVGTQTDYMEGSNSKFMSTIDCGGDNVSTKRLVTAPDTYTNSNFPGLTQDNSFPYPEPSDTTDYDPSQFDWSKMSKNAKRLPPRLLKKYLQERGHMEGPRDNFIKDFETNQHDEVSPDSDANVASLHTISKDFSSLSVDGHVADSQNACDTELSDETNYENEASALEQNEDLSQKFVMEEISPSSTTVTEHKPPSLEKRSPQMSPSQSFITSAQPDQSRLLEDIRQVDSEDLRESETNIPSSSFLGEEDLEHEMEVISDREGMEPETGAKKIDDQAPKVKIRIERDTTIRYTSQQLRDLNPFRGLPSIPLWELWEPKDILDKMIVLKNPGKSSLKEEETIEVRSNSKSKLDQSALESNWRTGIDASSENKKPLGSSVDPSPATAKSNQLHSDRNSDKQAGGYMNENIFLNKGSGLQGIASDLFKSVEATKDVADGEDWNSGEMWHDDPGHVADVGEFLKPVNRNESGKGKKSKKKRGREIPLDQFLQEQEAKKKVSEQADIVDEDDSLVSAESLKMYEELEQQGVGIDAELDRPVSIRFGSLSSSSKRPSMFTSMRPEQPSGQRTSKPWTPAGRRFCTRCGSKDHVVYDCNEMSSRLLQ